MTDRATRPEAFAAPSQGEPLGHGAERALLDGRRPRLLDDVWCALQVVAGHVDLFAVPIEGGAASGLRSHLCRIETGGIILSLPFVKADSQEQPLGGLAVGGQGAETLVLDRRLIDDLEALATWIARLCSAIAGAAAGWGAREAQLGATFTLEAGDRIRAPGHGGQSGSCVTSRTISAWS